MTEVLEKIKSIIKDSKTFALLSKKNSEDCRLLAKEALKSALSKNNLEVILLAEEVNFQKKWGDLLSETKESLSPRKTSIRIPKNQYKIKELSYEDGNEFLSLLVTTENKELDKNAIILEPVLPKADAVFCFFEPSEIETLREFAKEIEFPPKEKIIFLAENGTTFAEKITHIIKAIFPAALSLQSVSTLLFASLITETNNFIRPVSQEVLRFGSEILSLGADKESVKKIINEEKTISSAQLLGRALARTQIDETFGASWTFLSQKDLEKTGNSNSSSQFFYNIVKNLRENIPSGPISLLFWQAPSENIRRNSDFLPERLETEFPAKQANQNVFALAAAEEEKILLPLAAVLGMKLQSKYFISGPFDNFSEAELRFRNAFKEIFSIKI